MFRFIHAADPHLDSPMIGLKSREDAPAGALRSATRRAFQDLVRLAIAEEIDFLVIAGDLYDRDWKDYNTGLFLRNEMSRLRDAGIPVYMIYGNHDAASIITRKLSFPENVHDFSSRAPECKSLPDLPVTIHGYSFPNRSVMENLVPRYPDPVSGHFNLGILHTSLSGSEGHDTYAPCSLEDLSRKGYDYWALGHIHKPEVLYTDPWIVYAGNCQGRSVKETGPRGCRLVTVNDSLEVAEAEWRDLDHVRWTVLESDLSGIEDEEEAFEIVFRKMNEAIEHAGDRLVAARVIFTGATPLHGKLHGNFDRFEAEVLGRAQDVGQDSLWIEQVKVATTPVYDVSKLAERDSLIKIVLESLDGLSAGKSELPEEVQEMFGLLPSEVQATLETDLNQDSGQIVISDVRSIVLEAMRTMGGEET